MLIRSFRLKAVLGMAVASLAVACAEPRPQIYPATIEPRSSELAQSLEATPDLITKLPVAGDVLIAGGAGGLHTSLKTAEFYDPTTKKFTVTGSMAATRAGFGSVAFNAGALDHKVVVAGGASGKAIIAFHSLHIVAAAAGTAEQYDPTTGKFTATGNLVNGRAFFATTQLNDGTVLITGGVDSFGTPMTSAEIFDPATGMFTATTGAMSIGRALHTATLLNDHTVLIAGGVTTTGALDTSNTTEIYNPATKTFSSGATMILGTAGHTATLIAGCSCALDGKVLMTGGFFAVTSSGTGFANSTNVLQIYDPTGHSFSFPTTLIDDRAFQTATLLPSGKVLIAGGLAGSVKIVGGSVTAFPHGGARNSAEIFDPVTSTLACVKAIGTTHCAASMVNARAGQSATLFTSGPLTGEVLLAGGVGGLRSIVGTPRPLLSAELYNPATGATGAFTTTGAMHSARVLHQAALLQ